MIIPGSRGELNVLDADLEMCQETAGRCFKKVSNVRLDVMLTKTQTLSLENAVQCSKAFLDNGGVKSISFQVFTEAGNLKNVKLWRQKLLRHFKRENLFESDSN